MALKGAGVDINLEKLITREGRDPEMITALVGR